jgi:hypothetical protein
VGRSDGEAGRLLFFFCKIHPRPPENPRGATGSCVCLLQICCRSSKSWPELGKSGLWRPGIHAPQRHRLPLSRALRPAKKKKLSAIDEKKKASLVRFVSGCVACLVGVRRECAGREFPGRRHSEEGLR